MTIPTALLNSLGAFALWALHCGVAAALMLSSPAFAQEATRVPKAVPVQPIELPARLSAPEATPVPPVGLPEHASVPEGLVDASSPEAADLMERFQTAGIALGLPVTVSESTDRDLPEQKEIMEKMFTGASLDISYGWNYVQPNNGQEWITKKADELFREQVEIARKIQERHPGAKYAVDISDIFPIPCWQKYDEQGTALWEENGDPVLVSFYPQWLETLKRSPYQFEAALTSYLTRLTQHLIALNASTGNRVEISYLLFNEALNEKGEMKAGNCGNPLMKVLGPSYMDTIIRVVRAADPQRTITIRYNDNFNRHTPWGKGDAPQKLEKILEICTSHDFDECGYQGHVFINQDPGELRQDLDYFLETLEKAGKKAYLSEIDVLNPWPHTALYGNKGSAYGIQAEIFTTYMEACLQHRNVCDKLGFWGIGSPSWASCLYQGKVLDSDGELAFGYDDDLDANLFTNAIAADNKPGGPLWQKQVVAEALVATMEWETAREHGNAYLGNSLVRDKAEVPGPAGGLPPLPKRR